MINKFKALDNIGLISYLSKLILAIRKFFATKSEMDVVATALTDLDRRKIEASDVPTYSTATSDTLGLVKIGYTKNDKNYPVELSNGQMYVKVPWTDTNTDTWREITDSYDGTDSTISLSQKGGKALYDNLYNALNNGYALSAGNADTVNNYPLYPRDLGVNDNSWTFASTESGDPTTNIYAPTNAGTLGQVLKSTGGTPTWTNQSDLSVGYASLAEDANTLGGLNANAFIQNITIGTVNTGNPGTEAKVTISGEKPNIVLNFTIPKGLQGDMHEKDDAGYTDLEDRTYIYYCQAVLGWQYQSDTNYRFANRLQVPIPSYNVILSKADCIKMTKDVTLLVENATYKWSQLHWLLQCSSDSKNQIVYVTKYGTDDSNIPFSINKSGNIKSVPATIEIVVSCEPGTKALYHIQITVENVYGKAYYSYIGQITDTNKKEIDK